MIRIAKPTIKPTRVKSVEESKISKDFLESEDFSLLFINTPWAEDLPIFSSTSSSANATSLSFWATKESSSSISSSLSNDSLGSSPASSSIESVFSFKSTSSVDSITFASIESSKLGLIITPPSMDSSSKASDSSKSLYSLWIGMISSSSSSKSLEAS